jgi:GT2 family glycosyltransferase/glycosyltransferase involved in cell wall biosynthesis
MGETAAASDLSRDNPFPAALRVSLFEALDERRGAISVGASRALDAVRVALHADDFPAALRNLDHAWRCIPEDVAALAPIYGRLLMAEARDHDAALRLLQRAIELVPDPDTAALIAVALLRLRRPEEARQQLEQALAAYCVSPGGLLFHAAGEVIRHPDVRAPGWVGRGPNLEFVGELSAAETSNVLDIQFDARGELTQRVMVTPRDARRIFNFNSVAPDVLATCEVKSRGVPLLGSGARIPPDFALDGRAGYSGTRLGGWARLGWSPTHAVRVRLEDENGDRASGGEVQSAELNWRWPFEIDLPSVGLKGHRLTISAQLPDGRWQPLPDSPLLIEAAVHASCSPAGLSGWRPWPPRRASLIDVIIPVYRGREETLACIDSVLATTDGTAQIVVVDDATDDAVLVAALDALAAGGRIVLVRNAVNQGFGASVNRALALHPTHDAVLLNSDTRVFGDWLARLREAAYSGPAVGSVTPLSNNGSIASYPHALGTEISPDHAAALHAITASENSGLRVEIPVGVGFCMYLRRDCLQEVGSLDADVFGKGYGEEVDYCLRARSRGWSHQLAADVFVFHAGGRSFGARRQALLDRSQRLLNLRHPGYDHFVADFQAQDPLQVVRRRLDERRLKAFEGRFVLLVSLALTGGVERFVAERCAEVRARGLFPLILKAAEPGNGGRCELWTDAIEAPNLRYDIPADLSALVALLGALSIESIEVQHFLHLDARVIDAVIALPIPYDVFVHDYAWICPRITLIDGSGRYCGEPAVSVCETCVKRNGSSLGEEISVAALRARSAEWFRRARQVFAPSADAVERLQRHFADLNVTVLPHATQVLGTPLPPRDSARARVRVALIGAIGEHKGYQVLLACARDARDRGLPLEFVVIGYTENDAPLLETGVVFVTGRYTEGEAPHLLQREQPDIAWLPSVWPETWCYTLDYALGAGLPIAAFDVGAIAERLRALGRGELMALGLEPKRINDRLLSLAAAQRASTTVSRSEERSLSRARYDTNNAITPSIEIDMTDSAPRKPTEAVQPPEAAAEDGLSASVQVLPLPAGLYLFSVNSSGSPRADTGQLALPAMHVGLGPGMRPEQMQFMEGAADHGAWLFAATDQLVAKIAAGGATMILTSVRAPGGEALSIKVERLNARLDATLAFSAPVPGVTARANSGLAAAAAPRTPVFGTAAANLPLSVQIGAHIRTRGDMTFADVPWAGRIAPGLWIESFSVLPLEQFGAGDIEYKGLTGSGFETPWLSDDQACGTKGMGVPLVGFALRLKATPAASGYDCEYSGYFQSGLTVGPLLNGAPCRSTVANDPLEGIEIRLIRHPATGRRMAPRAVACV